MQDTPDEVDRALVRAMARGDVNALSIFYARHGPTVLAYVSGKLSDRQLAEEVLQDTMLAVWRAAVHFRGESSVRSWLLAIARRRVSDAWRRQPAEHLLPADPADPDSNIGDLAIAAVERDTVRTDIQAALQRLSAEQREMLELIFFHQLSGPEAAAVLGVPSGTVKSRLHRAKEALRKLLQREDIDHA